MSKPWINPIPDRYEPWEFERFHGLYAQVINPLSTQVDIIRCWELWDLVKQTSHLPGVVLEVGCWRGGSGVIIADGANPKKVYLCDTFKGTVKGQISDLEYSDNGQFKDASEEGVKNLLGRMCLDNVEILIGIFPDETGPLIIEDKISFCHIDVDVYRSVRDSFEWVWPRLVIGGVIVFDDYGYLKTPGIKRFVNEINYGEDRMFIHNINEHAILIKLR